MLFDYEEHSKFRKIPSPSALSFPNNIRNDFQQSYNRLPTRQIEFGGILCGNIDRNNRAVITKTPWIPSATATDDTFIFDTGVIKRRQLYCGRDNILGMWHTHSRDSPLPSKVDRETTQSLDVVGCVVSDNIRCFKGNKNIPIH